MLRGLIESCMHIIPLEDFNGAFTVSCTPMFYLQKSFLVVQIAYEAKSTFF